MRKKLATILMLLLVPLSALSCVSSKKTKKEPTEKLDKYVVSEAPKDIKKLGVNFEDKITLVGYEMTGSRDVKPGDKVSYKLYWKVNKEIGEGGWKLYTHVLNQKNKKLLNIDGVGPLRDYGKSKNQALPPSDWKAGKVYIDKQDFTVPRSADDKLKIVTGIWKGKKRLNIKGGPNIGEDRALVTTLNVKGVKPKERPPKIPELRVDRLAKGASIKIDGKLDEEAWKTAANTGAFVNVKSGKRDPKSDVQGSAKLTWDEDALYIGFEVDDENVVGGFDKGTKDPHLWTKDTVEIMIDPDGNGDNKDYYELQVNPQNLVFDSQFDDYNEPKGGPDGPFGHQEWSSKLTSAVTINGTLDKDGDKDKGYTVEIKLPWKSLDKAKTVPPEVGQRWRMNFYAMQNNGGVAWAPIRGKGNFHKASQFGKILWAEEGWKPQPMVSTDAVREAAARMGYGKGVRGNGTAATAPAGSAPPAAVKSPAAAKSNGVGAAKPRTTAPKAAASAPRPPIPAPKPPASAP